LPDIENPLALFFLSFLIS